MLWRIVFLLFLALELFATDWKTQRETLDHLYAVEKFRIFYTLKGENAIEDQIDLNKNTIPDFVENIALQLQTANTIFSQNLGLIEPLNNSVYTKRADYIDVHILKIKTHNNGFAGDAVVTYNYAMFALHYPAITITLSSSLAKGNLTPLHELFHAYQNGYSTIKNRWYSEGTARWSENILSTRTEPIKKLPTSIYELEQLFQRTYKNEDFWSRLAYLYEPNDISNLSMYQEIKYINSNKSIVQTNSIYGRKFMQAFLKNLDLMDAVISQERGIKEHRWNETLQKDPYNNRYILLAILKTIEQKTDDIAPHNELKNFITLLRSYLFP